MANRNTRNRRSSRESYRDDDFDQQQQGYRQEEQFSSGNEWNGGGYDPGYGQMGETGYGNRSDQPGSRYESGGGTDERYGREGGGYTEGRKEPRIHRRHGYGPARYDAPGRGFASFTSEDQSGHDFNAPTRPQGFRSYNERMNIEPTGGRYAGGEHRGWFDRATDEVASWFGDDEAERRREHDHREDHRGRGPQNYTRSDERILEDACDNLTDDWAVDARNIQVTVNDGEITLDGTVSSRAQKRRAEDCVDCLSGVGHVQNNLRVVDRSQSNRSDTIATEQRAEKS